MKTELLLIQIVLWTITLVSVGIVREFYVSTKTNGLRARMIGLFVCKIWIYGGAAIIFLIWPPADGSALFRILLLNAPMFIVMLWLWGYVRTHLK